MAEETLIEGEGEGLNPEAEKKTTYTAEEVEAIRKELASNSEKGVQKVIHEKKLLEATIAEIGKVAEDQSYLVTLHEKNPEVARKILEQYYDGQSIDSFKQSIGYEEDFSDPETVKRHIERETERRLEAKALEDAKSAFVKKLEMGEDEKKAFEEAFEERRQMKSFKVSDVEKHLEKAYREIADEDQTRKLSSATTMAKSMATGNGNASGGKSEPKADPAMSEISEFLKKYAN